MKRSIFFIGALFVFAVCVHAKTVEGVTFPETMIVGDQHLVLNGAGLRTKRRFGINWRVYVAGLYVKAESKDAVALITDKSVKVIDMSFLRSLDADTLREAWSDGFKRNCQWDCATLTSNLQAFNQSMVDVKDGSHLQLTFDENGVKVEFSGTKADHSAQISGEAFRKSILAIFIGKEPPTEDFKKSLLGSG